MRAGDIVGERFVIDRRIAAGGMGAVYRASDRVSGAPIALKVMLDGDRTGEERFLREAGMLAGVSHEALVSYVAHGDGPTPWLAMEWLEGEDLAARLSRGPLSIDETLAVCRRVAAALSVLHARGFVHRDVKPSNIFLVSGDAALAKLLDLGVARPLDDTAPLTRTGFAIGTPYYMAPEQARSAPDLDARADVFGLGCVLFECLRGHSPFAGRDVVEVLAKIVLAPAPPLDVSPALDALVERMLAKDRALRPVDGRAVVEELARANSAAAVRAIGVREQRVITLLLTGKADPLARTLDRAAPDPIAQLRVAAERAGARVESLANGAVLIVLTEPALALDQSRRAAELALQIRSESPGLPLSIAIGRAELTDGAPIGEAVERAARALDHAASGRIRVDAASAALLGGRFAIAHDEGGAYLEGARVGAGAARRLLGRPTAFVGRDRELAVLEGLYRESIDEPRARVALVSGPAGVGKSRLRDELVARLDEAEVFLGGAEVSRAGTSFGLLANAIRRSARLDEGDDPRALLRARVARALSGDALERALPFIGEIAAVHFDDHGVEALRAARRDPMLMGDAVRSAMEDWMRAECDARPIAFVLDDAHWGDAPSMRVIDSLLRALEGRPFFVVALARPEIHAVFPALFRDRDVQELRLSAMGRRACEQLVRQALGETASPQIVAWIVDRAGGNAFFLEELIRAAANGATEVPDTVLGVVQARLDALGATAKRLLRAGSVFGDTFWRAGVDAVLEEETAAAALHELAAVEVIEPRAPARFAADEAFGFRHALLRDAAYAMLTAGDRAVAHGRAAAWLEGRGARDPVELAEHYLRAGDGARAARFFAEAAEAALEGNDLAGADARASQGIACGAVAALLGQLYLVQTIAAMWRGAHADAMRLSEAAISLLPPGSPRWFRAVAESMSAAGRTGDAVALGAGAHRLLTVDADPDAVDEQVIALCRSMIPLSNATLADTDRVLDRAVAIAREKPQLGAMARAQLLEARGLRQLLREEFPEGMGLLEAAIAEYERAGAVRDQCLTSGSLAWAQWRAGFNEEALAVADAAQGLALKHGLEQPRWWATFMRACVLSRVGRHREALPLLEECLVVYRRQGNARHEGWAGIELATSLFAVGRADEAERAAAVAAELLGAIPIFSVRAFATRARVLLALGRVADARPVVERARAAFASVKEVAVADALFCLADAELARAEGQDAVAAAIVAEAAEEMLRRAALLAPIARQRYLAIPEHAELLGMAASASRR